MTNITYNSYSLQDAEVTTRSAEHFSGGKRDIMLANMGRANKQSILASLYKEKTIIVEGTIRADSQSELHTEIDSLKEALDAEDANLDIEYGGSNRRYKATPVSVQIPEEFYNLTWVPYRIEFFCADPFGYNTATANRSVDTITTSQLASTVTFAGNFGPEPSVTITMEDVNAVTQVKLTNSNTGDIITVTTAFSDSDILVINHETKKVTLNGTEIDYTGLFPQWEAGQNNFILDIAKTQVTADLDIDYTAKWL